MDKISTKDRILEAALTLFSEKGYDGVGVDLIAEKAGLKGPSIYKHFKGKAEILEVLLERVESYYEMNFGSEMHLGKLPDTMDEFIDISLKRIRFTLHDERIRKTRRILTMEQFRNPRIAKIATKHNIEGTQGLHRKLFQEMMAAGVMKQSDPVMLSMSFTAPITLLIQMCDREPEREQEAMEQITDYLTYFATTYGIS